MKYLGEMLSSVRSAFSRRARSAAFGHTQLSAPSGQSRINANRWTEATDHEAGNVRAAGCRRSTCATLASTHWRRCSRVSEHEVLDGLDWAISRCHGGTAISLLGANQLTRQSVHDPDQHVRPAPPPRGMGKRLLRAEHLQPQRIRCIIPFVVRQGLRRPNRAEQAAEILSVTHASQCAHWHRRQPDTVNAAHGNQRVHPAPTPRGRLTSFGGVCATPIARTEFLRPSGSASSWSHCLKPGSGQSRRGGQSIQVDRSAAQGEPMRRAVGITWSHAESAQQRRQTKAVQLRKA